MNFLLNIKVAGEPIAQERHRYGNPKGRGWRNYDPNTKDKENFQLEIRAAAPHLKPTVGKRLGVFIEIWSAKKPIEEKILIAGKRQKTGKFHYQTDWDNYGKFYCDAMTGMVWENDCWIEDGRVLIHRNEPDPAVRILVWDLAE